MENDDIIELNVGGQTMATRRSTLCQVEGSLLAPMFGGRWKGNMMRDKDGRFFLDFNPKYFGFILDYLRAKAIAITGRPAKLPKVDLDEVNNFYELIEYLGLGCEMLPPESESFKEHSPGFTLEENGTMAAYRSKSPTKKNSRGYPNPVYSEPQNEFIFGNNCYEGGIMRLKLEMEVKYMESLAGHIWVGVVPSEVTPEHARRTIFCYPGQNFYGWGMDCCDNGIKMPFETSNRPWYYSNLITIEIILDCDTRKLYLKFHDGKQLSLKLARWNKWRLLLKLSCRNPYEDTQERYSALMPVSVRACILKAFKEY